MPATAALTRDRMLIILPWPDPDADDGHDALGRYAELFVLPVLGPTSLWLLRRLVDGLTGYPDGYELDLTETAGALGLNFTPDRPGPFTRAVHRLVMFGYARPVPYGMAVRRTVNTLAPRQLERLPGHLRRLHAAEITPARTR